MCNFLIIKTSFVYTATTFYVVYLAYGVYVLSLYICNINVYCWNQELSA